MSIVNKEEIIDRLGKLLARVRMRSAEPRLGAMAPPTTSFGTLSPPQAVSPASPQPPPVIAQDVMAPSAPRLDPNLEQSTSPPTVDAFAETAAAAPEEPLVDDALDSQERLVRAEPVPLEHGSVGDLPGHGSVSHPAAEQGTPGPNGVEGVDASERAPVSSRRPVIPEPQDLAELAFGTETLQEPRHTPPPESGPLPAPPATDFDGDVRGVRESAPVSPHRSEEIVALALGARTSLEIAPREAEPLRELIPQATRPQLVPNDSVADVLGEAQRFAPPTFLALLDASLRL